jgi:hypothetical protein
MSTRDLDLSHTVGMDVHITLALDASGFTYSRMDRSIAARSVSASQ